MLKQQQILDATKSRLTNLDAEFNHKFGTTFTKQMKKQFGPKTNEQKFVVKEVLRDVKEQQDKTALVR